MYPVGIERNRSVEERKISCKAPLERIYYFFTRELAHDIFDGQHVGAWAACTSRQVTMSRLLVCKYTARGFLRRAQPH